MGGLTATAICSLRATGIEVEKFCYSYKRATSTQLRELVEADEFAESVLGISPCW